MSHNVVVMKKPQLMGASGEPGPEGEEGAAPAKVTGPSQIGADIAKNRPAVQRQHAAFAPN
jgi:hypothetical protein